MFPRDLSDAPKRTAILGALVLLLFLGVAGGCGGGGGGTPDPQPSPPPSGKTFGGPADDFSRSVQQTPDNGYIIAGYTNSRGAGGYDAYLMRTDAAGNVLGEKTLGSAGDDVSFSVVQSQDGGFVITGAYNVSGLNPPQYTVHDLGGQIFLRKVDSNLDLVWEKTIELTGGFPRTLGYAVAQTSDGGYIIAGAAGFNLGGMATFLCKTDGNGNVQWTASPATGGGKLATAVQQTSDGGYAITISKVGPPSPSLAKIDSSGTLVQWTTILNGSAESVSRTSDGGYIVTGESAINSGDLYLAKLDGSGNILWEKTFGSAGGETGYSVQETADQGFIVAGRGSGGGPNHGFDAYLVKTAANGSLQWEKYFGGLGDDSGFSARQTSDGGYVLAGHTKSKGAGSYDAYLIKTDSSGIPQW